MSIKDIVAVSGVPGLGRMVSSRTNGILVEDLSTRKTKFYSVRKHQFTPLETVSIYTVMDTAELKDVFMSMHRQAATLPIPSSKATNNELTKYFSDILPDYDQDRVYPSDIKKVIKWYNNLEEHGLVTASDEEE